MHFCVEYTHSDCWSNLHWVQFVSCGSLFSDPKLAKYFEMMLAANVAREVVAKQMVKDGLNPK